MRTNTVVDLQGAALDHDTTSDPKLSTREARQVGTAGAVCARERVGLGDTWPTCI